jgi:hypothetical protein
MDVLKLIARVAVYRFTVYSYYKRQTTKVAIFIDQHTLNFFYTHCYKTFDMKVVTLIQRFPCI